MSGTSDGVAILATNPDGASHTSSGSGLGLRGIAERVSLLGGTLRHGPASGGYELAATLPLDRA